MATTSENQMTGAITGFIAGAVVGAGIALLLAPCSGEETRRQLGETAQRLKQGAQDRLSKVKDTLNERSKDVRAAVNAGREAYSARSTSDSPAPMTREPV